MKTPGFQHQLQALRRMNGREYYALFAEPGVGKTWMLLADAERLYSAGVIDAVFVIAPKGVHTNWVRREIPAHCNMPLIARVWSSGMNKTEIRKLEELFKPRELGTPPPLRLLAMNIDAVNTDSGFDYARRFLRVTKAMVIVDESHRMKNPESKRTIRIMRLAPLSVIRRIATGTPITQAPMDVFAQMEFLESGLLGTTSYRSFVAEYADVMETNPSLLEDGSREKYFVKALIKRNSKAKYAQIIRRDENGNPIWRNLEKLKAKLDPHCFRVLKKDCLDLPEKIYQNAYFELAPAQRRAYDSMEEDLRVHLEDGTIITAAALAALMKLQQITSGFILVREPGEMKARAVYVSENNPRLDTLIDIQQDLTGKFIVWARFREELATVARALTAAGRRVVQYHGGVDRNAREDAVDRFQTGDADVFVGQAQSGGIGLTLTAAETVVYYSNDFNLGTRLQSEDRAHRIGTTKRVLYIDLTAQDTIDESIARALQRKSSMAAEILGDRNIDLRNLITEFDTPELLADN